MTLKTKTCPHCGLRLIFPPECCDAADSDYLITLERLEDQSQFTRAYVEFREMWRGGDCNGNHLG